MQSSVDTLEGFNNDRTLSYLRPNLIMSETPSWLAGGSQAPAPASSPLEVSSPSPTASGGSTQLSGAAATSDDEKDLPSIILMMRLTNMGLAAAIITGGVSTYSWISHESWCLTRQ